MLSSSDETERRWFTGEGDECNGTMMNEWDDRKGIVESLETEGVVDVFVQLGGQLVRCITHVLNIRCNARCKLGGCERSVSSDLGQDSAHAFILLFQLLNRLFDGGNKVLFAITRHFGMHSVTFAAVD